MPADGPSPGSSLFAVELGLPRPGILLLLIVLLLSIAGRIPWSWLPE